jgi:tetratricopeptide (TPR) repeat protein
MRSRLTRMAVLMLGLTVLTAGCGKYSISNIRAMQSFKEGNELYRKGDFQGAIARYEETLQRNPDFLGITYFFIGNSYDNLYKPARRGEADNDAYLQKAVENYELAIKKIKDDEQNGPEIRKRSYEFLIAAYGSDKLDDFSKAEPLARALIAMEPNEPSNYQALGNMYENQGMYDEAEAEFKKAVDVKPNDPMGYLMLAAYYNRQGEFEKTVEAFQARADREPNNPEAWHTMATFYQEKAYKDKSLPKATALEYVMKGIAADDKALALNSEYFEALSFKNILLRMEANLEKDPAKQKQLIALADELKSKAMALQKKQGAEAAGSD